MSEGWLPGARRVESPNADERPESSAIDLIVLHHISLPAGRFGGDTIERLFTNALDAALWPDLALLRVSAHFLIRRDGEIVQFVDIRRRAWHAGVSAWRGRSACNDFSVGIELEGDTATSFEPAQYARLDPLLAWLHSQTGARALTTHSEIAAGRKIDPGPTFDFSRVVGLPNGHRWQI